jgi:hypothetical protein
VGQCSEYSILRTQVTQHPQRTKEIVHRDFEDKNKKLQEFKGRDQMNMDAIATLSDQVMRLIREIEILKKRGPIEINW